MLRRRTITNGAKYTSLNYLKADRNSWIDTGIVADQDTSVEIKWMNTDGWTYYDSHTLIGADSGNWHSNSMCVSTYGNGSFNYDSSGDEGLACFTYSRNSIYISSLNKNVFSVNGNTVKTVTYTSFSTSNTLHICNYNEGSGKHEAGNERIYYCKIWENGTLVRDFIPVLDSKGVACMYDKINDAFHYNSGTGTFTYA